MENDLGRIRDEIRRYQALLKLTTDAGAVRALDELIEEAEVRLGRLVEELNGR